ncbi:hypothetical protein [Nocardia sp. NPDC052566]|uniref:hypothetical protein n=1 Tax=Nocardia sp. NPDC052566 TaxID=3364330 RepID=UPI0037C96F0E
MSGADDIEAIMDANRRFISQLQMETEERRQRESEEGKELREAFARAEAEAEAKAQAEAEAREAIARSIAARKANENVAPIDDEDEESAYYRRKSWLI